MVHNPRVLALLLAICIALMTSLFLALFESMSPAVLLVTFMVSFLGSFLFAFVLLEFVVFREINNIHHLIRKLRKKELSATGKQKPAAINPLRAISEEISSFAEQKQQEIDELRKLEAFRKEFIANISHELKTPIFAAQGFLHTLLDGAVDDKTVRNKFLKKAAKSLDGLDALVQDLLTLSQIETGQTRMHRESVDVYRLTEEVLDQFESRSVKRNVKLRIAGPPEKVIVYADGQRISQVITNLVSNAINHSHDGGEIVVSFMTGRKKVTVSVADTGEGIPPEHMHRIFERFYRVDKSRSREKGGTGLGLAIVKHILDGHQTRATVTSTPGKGSVFSFKLPRNKEVMDL